MKVLVGKDGSQQARDLCIDLACGFSNSGEFCAQFVDSLLGNKDFCGAG